MTRPRHSGILTFETVAEAEAASINDGGLCWVIETHTLYEYNESDFSADSADHLRVLSTADGGDTRWIGVAGTYHRFNGIQLDIPQTIAGPEPVVKGGTSVFLGYLAGQLSYITDGNVGIGSETLRNLDSNNDNEIAVGMYALRELTNGNYNTALGYAAACYLETGDANIAIGYGAFEQSTAGSYNVVIGKEALNAASANMSSNVVIGHEALSVGDHDSCVAIGFRAGKNSVGTVDGCVFIGYRAGESETNNDKLHIANNESKSLIEGVFTADEERAAVHGELRQDVDATENNFRTWYSERFAVGTGWTTLCTLTPSAVASVYTRGAFHLVVCNARSDNVTGVRDAYWYFEIANAAPTVGTIRADVTSGTPANVQLAVAGNVINVQVQAQSGTVIGTLYVELFAPEDFASGLTYTFTH